MHNTNTNLFKLSDYILSPSEALRPYIIHNKKKGDNCTIYEATIKSSSQLIDICKFAFKDDLEYRNRFIALKIAHRKRLIMTEDLFLSNENGHLYMYTVEPRYSGSKEKYVALSELLRRENLDYLRKQKIFQNLLLLIRELHHLGETHFEVYPKNIWVEENYNVRIKPFKLQSPTPVDFSEANDSKQERSRSWYTAPELLSGNTYLPSIEYLVSETDRTITDGNEETMMTKFASDLWSLGCIFTEMFATATPIFQSVGVQDTLTKHFETLGVPKASDVYYMNPDLYKMLALQTARSETDAPLIDEILNNLTKSEGQIITSLLLFNPNKRLPINILLELPFFKSYTSQRQSKRQTSYIIQALGGSTNKNAQSNMISNPHQPSRAKSRENNDYRHAGIYRSFQRKKSESGNYSMLEGQISTSLHSSIQCQGDWWNTDLIEPNQNQDVDVSICKNTSETPFKSSYSHYSLENNHNNTSKFGKRILPEEIAQINFESCQPEANLSGTQADVHHDQYIQSCAVNQLSASHKIIEESQRDLYTRRIPSGPETQVKKPSYIDNTFSTPKPFKADKASVRDRRRDMSGPTKRVLDMEKVSLSPPSKKRELMSEMKNQQNHEFRRHDLSESFKKTLSAKASVHYDEPQHIPSSFNALVHQADVKLSVNIETIKDLKQEDEDESYSCKISLKSASSEDPTATETTNLFSCFAPLKNKTVDLDFKGETHISVNSLLQMCQKNSLKIQVFRKAGTESDKEDTDLEAALYGVCKLEIPMDASHLQNIMRKEKSIQISKGWYYILHPSNSEGVVGQMKVEVSVDLMTNMREQLAVEPSYSTPLKKSNIPKLNKGEVNSNTCENRYGNHQYMRRILLNSCKKDIPNTVDGKAASRPSYKSENKKADTLEREKGFGINVSIFDAIQEDLEVLSYTLKKREKERENEKILKSRNQI